MLGEKRDGTLARDQGRMCWLKPEQLLGHEEHSKQMGPAVQRPWGCTELVESAGCLSHRQRSVRSKRVRAFRPSGLVTICKDVAFNVGRAGLGVYLQVHSDGHWGKGPATPWESPGELWR